MHLKKGAPVFGHLASRRRVGWLQPARELRQRKTDSANPCKHLQRVEQRLRLVLALINRRRRGAALEQAVNRSPRRAGGALDGEGYFPAHLDVLADESKSVRPRLS